MGDSQETQATHGSWLAWDRQTQRTTEARLPPLHIDVLPGTGLGIVGKGGTHSLHLPLWATACCGSNTVGKEAGFMVYIWGNL